MSSDEPYQDGSAQYPFIRRGCKLVASGIDPEIPLTQGGAQALYDYWKKKGEKPLPAKVADHILGEFAP